MNKSNLLLIIVWILFLGCNKKEMNDKNIPVENTIQNYVQENNETVEKTQLEENVIQNEKNIIFDKNNNEIKIFLKGVFEKEEYIIMDEPLKTEKRNIWFAIHYINETPPIFNIAVGFEIDENKIHRFLLYKNFKFINEDNNIFMDFSPEKYPNIYGFNFTYSYPTVEGYYPGLIIDGYFDKGKRVADSFTIEWREDLKQFNKISFN